MLYRKRNRCVELSCLMLLVCAQLLALPACAEFLVVRRQAAILDFPARGANILEIVEPTSEDPLRILFLDQEQPREGNYLRVWAASVGDYGYVYKTAGRVYRDYEGPYQPYDRREYRHWIDEDRDCLDTRQEVLYRDDVSGRAKIERHGGKCSVIGGEWIDVYTGARVDSPARLDIDHLVPLKNAHESGAWAWSPVRKQEYANYLVSSHHLLAVSASENRRKGDRGPDEYLPPNDSHHCEYAERWLEVKQEWGLYIKPSELSAILQILDDCPYQLMTTND